MIKILFFYLIFILLCEFCFAQNIGIVDQRNDASNSLLYLNQNGESNLLNGFASFDNGVEDFGADYDAAIQYSQSGGKNNLYVEQINPTVHNEITLYQDAALNNTGTFMQSDGSHQIMLNQISIEGSNTSTITQTTGSGYINLKQKALFDNVIPSAGNTLTGIYSGPSGIYQEGNNNFIYGAEVSYALATENKAITAPDIPAMQISEGGSNWLEIWQTGDNNVVGLHQEGYFDNTAFIQQYDGNNTAVIYQKGMGPNSIHVEQAGGMAAYIYQNGGGNNMVVVKQH